MLIVFIVDGNNKLGMGHVYQVSTLVKDILLSNLSDVEIKILTKSDDSVVSFLKGTGCQVTLFKDDRGIYEYLKKEKPNSIVIDNLDVSVSFSKKIKENLDSKLLIFTNLSKANQYADVTLLADIGSEFVNIFKVNEATRSIQIFGPKYWIMRSEFFLESNKGKTKNKVNKIMLIFGGSDPSNFSLRVLKEILSMSESFNVSVVLGLGYEDEEEIKSLIYKKKYNSVSKIFRNVKNIAHMMADNDLVIASPGLSFFESLVVGTPVIGVHHTLIQKDAYKSLVETVGEFELESIPEMIRSKEFLYADSVRVMDMEIGQGKNKIINEIITPL